MVNEQRIEPQLAMRVVARFDRAIAEILAERVKARLNFKVRRGFPPLGLTIPTIEDSLRCAHTMAFVFAQR